ncbi:hypothetical protein PS627_01203 [Pseudomonas fluorescens]|uniref:hypothetical protein n=1 Tax=Pseudomonas fluorescens TaxID=294 RepID=UPI001253AA74|nr:hypothetical protein [Pseudomonas fluorescens]CAG8865295.1 hypothetical protein PS627_01203 [Pseudomonas fluorescens]
MKRITLVTLSALPIISFASGTPIQQTCQAILSPLVQSEQVKIEQAISLMLNGEAIAYVTGQRSAYEAGINKLANDRTNYTNFLGQFKEQLKGHEDKTSTFAGGLYATDSRKNNTEAANILTKQAQIPFDRLAQRYLNCEYSATFNGKSTALDTVREYVNEVIPKTTSSQIGYFNIAATKGEVRNAVSTGNKYSEPDHWDGSRFFIVDASFKNLDTESRRPAEGSLYITYNGKEYEFDTTESIMTKGYNIWFKSVNPLITMKTKIVYRIPEEIYGDVYWKPGRNPNGVKLWVGNIPEPK